MRKMLAATMAVVTMMAAGAVPAAADDAALKQLWDDGPACNDRRALERMRRFAGGRELDAARSVSEFRATLGGYGRAVRVFEAQMGICARVIERQQASSPDGEQAQQLLGDGVRTVQDAMGALRRVLAALRGMTYAKSRAEVQRARQRALAAARTARRLLTLGERDLRRADRILRRI